MGRDLVRVVLSGSREDVEVRPEALGNWRRAGRIARPSVVRGLVPGLPAGQAFRGVGQPQRGPMKSSGSDWAAGTDFLYPIHVENKYWFALNGMPLGGANVPAKTSPSTFIQQFIENWTTWWPGTLYPSQISVATVANPSYQTNVSAPGYGWVDHEVGDVDLELHVASSAVQFVGVLIYRTGDEALHYGWRFSTPSVPSLGFSMGQNGDTELQTGDPGQWDFGPVRLSFPIESGEMLTFARFSDAGEPLTLQFVAEQGRGTGIRVAAVGRLGSVLW